MITFGRFLSGNKRRLPVSMLGLMALCVSVDAFAWHATSCRVWIKSVQNGKYATPEVTYTGDAYGMIRARVASRTTGQLFTVWRDAGIPSYRAFKATNGYFVTAELDPPYIKSWYGVLRAARSGVGERQQFTRSFEYIGGRRIEYLRSRANGNVVSVEVGYTGGNEGMMRARTFYDGGPWEKLEIISYDAACGNDWWSTE